jgi:hypothetical protein
MIAMERTFEWDEKKAKANLKNHQVDFEEAASVFRDPLNETIYDLDHSIDEDRYITIGWSNRRRLLMVAFTERGTNIRIISARELTRNEREAYEEKS